MSVLNTPLSERFDAALALTHQIHRHQARKGGQIPYVAHVLGVAAIVLEYGGSEDEAIAALLHDVLEDAGEYAPEISVESLRDQIQQRFGTLVLNIVEHCTDTTETPKPPWTERKARYVTALDQGPTTALRVSAADKLHNLQSLIRDYRTHGDRLWARFNPQAGKQGTLGYYRSLVAVFEARMPGALTDDLERAFKTLESLSS